MYRILGKFHVPDWFRIPYSILLVQIDLTLWMSYSTMKLLETRSTAKFPSKQKTHITVIIFIFYWREIFYSFMLLCGKSHLIKERSENDGVKQKTQLMVDCTASKSFSHFVCTFCCGIEINLKNISQKKLQWKRVEKIM